MERTFCPKITGVKEADRFPTGHEGAYTEQNNDRGAYHVRSIHQLSP
jgi:hypothetical protein